MRGNAPPLLSLSVRCLRFICNGQRRRGNVGREGSSIRSQQRSERVLARRAMRCSMRCARVAIWTARNLSVRPDIACRCGGARISRKAYAALFGERERTLAVSSPAKTSVQWQPCLAVGMAAPVPTTAREPPSYLAVDISTFYSLR